MSTSMSTSMNHSGRADRADRADRHGQTNPSAAELEMTVLLSLCTVQTGKPEHSGRDSQTNPAETQPPCVFVLSRRLAAWAHSDVAELGPGWDHTSPIKAALQTIPGTGTTVHVLGAWPVDSRLCALAQAGVQHVTDEVRRYPSYEAAHAAHPGIDEHVVGLVLPESAGAAPRIARSLQRRIEADGRSLLA